MDQIKRGFENWFITPATTDKHRKVLLEQDKNGDYIYMQTRIAYDAFKAGVRASKSHQITNS